MANYQDMALYIEVTAFSGFTSVDFVLRAYNPRHVNDSTNLPQFNISNEFEWYDQTGTLVALTLSGGQNVFRVTATGRWRARLKNGYPRVVDDRLDLQWIVTGSGSITFDALGVPLN